MELEGYGEDPAGAAPGELPLVYLFASERQPRRSLAADRIRRLQQPRILDSPKRRQPPPRSKLPVCAHADGGRADWAQGDCPHRPAGLEERTSPLDATVLSGLAVPDVRFDQQAVAWVVGPLHMLVIGGGSGPAWISLRFQTLVPVSVPPQTGVRALVKPGQITACVRATGVAPVRRASIQLVAPALPGIVPLEPYAPPEPLQGVQLVAMRAVTNCSPSSSRIRTLWVS